MQETEIQTICRTISKEGWYKGYDGGPFDPPVAVKGVRRRKGATPIEVQYNAFMEGYKRGEADKLAGLPAARIRSRWISFPGSSPGRPRTDSPSAQSTAALRPSASAALNS